MIFFLSGWLRIAHDPLMENPATLGSAPLAAGSAVAAALHAMELVLLELSRLAIDVGIEYGQIDEVVKRSMVRAALLATAEHNPYSAPPVSRLSVMTGIHRKEVKRVANPELVARVADERSVVGTLFMRWLTESKWQDENGAPRVLPRRIDRDDIVDFEKLARSVTSDVHAKSLLDEMLRLDLVDLDPRNDTVSVRVRGFVPSGELKKVFALGGRNVADHIAAVRANLAAIERANDDASIQPPFLEQSVSTDELSAESAHKASVAATREWFRVVQSLAPEFENLEALDKGAGKASTHRVRVGMYCYTDRLDADVLPFPVDAGQEYK